MVYLQLAQTRRRARPAALDALDDQLLAGFGVLGKVRADDEVLRHVLHGGVW